MARERGVDILFAGDGGDELFAGNERYLQIGRFDVYGHVPGPLRRLMLDPLLEAAGRLPLSALQRARQLKRGFYKSTAERLYHYHHLQTDGADGYLSSDFIALIDPEEPISASATTMAVYGQYGRVEQMMGHDIQHTLADNDLRKVTSMCAHAGMDVLYPFLEPGVVSFSQKVPVSVMLAGGHLRGFYKQAMRGFLPEAILTKPKHGFGLPFAQWASADASLRGYLLDHLAGTQSASIFSPNLIAQVRHALISGENRGMADSASELVVLELWLAARGLSL